MLPSLRWMLTVAAPAAIVPVAAWLLFRDPGMRAVDFTRMTRYWQGLWIRVHDLPEKVTPALERTHVLSYRRVPVEIEPGVTMKLDPRDYIDRQLIANGFWERTEWHWVETHLRGGGVFVDVGAHEGTYTLKAAKHFAAAAGGGRVISVEPNPPTIALLKENIALSQARNIQIEEFACGDKAGTLTLYSGPAGNTGMASLSERNAARGQDSARLQSVDVPIRPLDEILAAHAPSNPRIDVIKIDTEGAEVSVLKGAMATIAKHRPALVLEVIPEQLQNMGTSLAELEKLLDSAGYRKAAESKDNSLWKPKS